MGQSFTFLCLNLFFSVIAKDYLEDFGNLLALENMKFFLYSGELRIANFTVTDKFFMISLFPKNQKHFDQGKSDKL